MAVAKDPLRQLIDIAVYAPIGLVLLAHKELPKLVASGRTRVDNQITLARFVGKMAVKRGRIELQRRLDAAEAARGKQLSVPVIEADSVELDSMPPPASVPHVPRSRSRAGTRTGDESAEPHAKASAAPLPEAIIAAVTAAPELKDDPVLPIDGYDSLAASQVVVRLGTLTAAELDEIRLHEVSHRARRTILGKISQLQAR